jgi:hypothetical protein
MLGNVFISCGELRLLGGIAIFLSVVGLPGLVALAGSQRTKELAVRLALGASHFKVFLSDCVAHRRMHRPRLCCLFVASFCWPLRGFCTESTACHARTGQSRS